MYARRNIIHKEGNIHSKKNGIHTKPNEPEFFFDIGPAFYYLINLFVNKISAALLFNCFGN